MSQLGQSHIPVTCDEGVYHIAREIMMNNPNEFKDIVLCLGSFHLIKVVMGAIGKYLEGGGADTILSETKVFGKNEVKTVLDGSHYSRALKGLLMLSEAIERLQWSEFFKQKGVNTYIKELTLLNNLKLLVSSMNEQHSKEELQAFIESSTAIINDFNAFKEERAKLSETFGYWNVFTTMVACLRDLVRADREGNWNLHLQSVQAVLPFFAACDRINYLRWASLYLEDMRKLPDTAPAVHQAFINGKFVVKRTSGKFCAVGADMCLEQTINRSQKSASGIIGSTKQKQFVARWEMIYHEMLSVVNLFRNVSGVGTLNTELHLKSEFRAPVTKALNGMVNDMITYIKENENPATSSPNQKLHNILTQEVATEDIKNDLLQFQHNSVVLYETFRTERFITKHRSLFDTIHRNNLKTFKTLRSKEKTPEVKAKNEKKQLAQAQKTFDISRVRGYDVRCLLKHDLVETSYLFDDDGLMVKPNKSELCTELEKKLKDNDYLMAPRWIDNGTVYIVDVMAWLRHMRTSSLTTFAEFCTAFMDMVNHMSVNAKRIDYVFDTYLEDSVKGGERARRSACAPIEINILKEDTPIPVSMESFWASSSNKAKLQQLLKNVLLKNAQSGVDIVVSGTGIVGKSEVEACKAIIDDNDPVEVPDLDISIEEADVRIIPHLIHAVVGGATRAVVLSNDTDVLVLLLHYWKMAHGHGLKELWMRAGTGKSTRYLPVHILAVEIGDPLCQILRAVHCLTGCDSTSKFGTKAAALRTTSSTLVRT